MVKRGVWANTYLTFLLEIAYNSFHILKCKKVYTLIIIKMIIRRKSLSQNRAKGKKKNKPLSNLILITSAKKLKSKADKLQHNADNRSFINKTSHKPCLENSFQNSPAAQELLQVQNRQCFTMKQKNKFRSSSKSQKELKLLKSFSELICGTSKNWRPFSTGIMEGTCNLWCLLFHLRIPMPSPTL